VTFLVEVSWPRGQLVREYTVLLDPPVFEEKPSAAPVVAAPTTGTTSAPAAGTVQRTPAPAAAPVESPAAQPAAQPAAPAETAGEYRVVRNDSLSQIAQRAGASGRSELNRFMITTFRANPAAFDGNINRLHRGAVLKLPGRDEWQALDAREAGREVGRQMDEWKGGASGRGSAGDGEAHLRLVPPKDTGEGAGTAPGKTATTPPAPAPAPSAADNKRLALQHDALAKLQQQGKAPAATPTPAPAPAKPLPVVPKAAPAPAATPTPEPAPTAAPKPAAKPKAVPAPAPEPSLLDSLTDTPIYAVLGGVVLLLAGLVAFRALRRRRGESTFDSTFEPEATSPATASPAPAPSRARGEDTHTIVVEESDDDSGEFVAPPIKGAPTRVPAIAAAKEPAPPGSIEDTLSSETAINLEQADPLAEADFHMAYGLYDQAADIVKLAIEREPARRDLKLKLLEVYFVWGNKDAFLDVARDLGRTRDQGAAGEWDKVVIMGRQIAGEDPLFAGAVGGGAGAAVDLDLEASGTQRMDLELLGEPASAAHTSQDADAVDLDLSQALGGSDGGADTGESPTLDPDHVDLLLDHEHAAGEEPPTGGTTREMRPKPEAPTIEMPAMASAHDVPTVETPALREDTVVEKLDAAVRRGGDRRVAPDATAELSLDDLGFEIDRLGESSTSLESLSATDHPADAPTMVAGLDERSRAMLDAASRKADLEPTRETPRPAADLEPTRETPRPNGAAAAEGTGTQRVLGTGDLDLDLDELAKALEHDTVEQPRRDEMRFSTDVFATGIRKAPNGVDLDVGTPLNEQRDPTVTERISADDLDLPELEPVTLSEVGTKLDLARAYMDMGDPDGARSILQEVLSEGSASQKTEAQRLIETLPG
jgi:pilus assembly protein FimV